jgi:hypothetical protein
MNDLPSPLTSADCDLRDFGYMPVDVQRVCDSDLAALETPEACWAAFLLWCKSWHQVPAASLPDDDRVLAKFTGYQRAPDAWQAIREGAIRGWIKCADGRLYHPVVAEKANEAWFAKHRRAHDQLCERVRKRNKARVEASLVPLEVPPLEQWIDMGRPLEKSLFLSEFRTPSAGKSKPSTGNSKPSGGTKGDFRRNDGEIPPENALKGEERRGKGTEREVNIIGTAVATVDPAPGSDDGTPTIPQDEGEWQRYFREQHGVELSATNVHDRRKAWPIFTAWVKAGVSTQQIDAAVSKARKESKEGIAFLPGYADRVLASMSRPSEAPRMNSEEQRRVVSKRHEDAWLAQEPESNPNVIDMEINHGSR